MTLNKVFGIGFHKTGTKSLAAALQTLGYRVAGPLGTMDPDIANTAWQHVENACASHDGFQDNPFPPLYREIDRHYPGSKFILTICPTDEWLARSLRYFGDQSTPMRQWIYGAGSPVGNESLYAKRYDQHNREVLAHFADRPDDLFVFDLIAAPRWEGLCRFLGHTVPAAPFPHRNRSGTA